MHVSFRRSLRCETLLYISTAAVPRLDLDENPHASLGPGFFSTLLARDESAALRSRIDAVDAQRAPVAVAYRRVVRGEGAAGQGLACGLDGE